MGWFWGSSDRSAAAAADPTQQLDPSLKKFLAQESPPAQPPPPSTAPPKPAATAAPTPKPPAATTTTTTTARVPAESLYPDGRFAHLWKTYEPLATVEARAKTDQEKLADIVAAYNDRRAGIGRAALENCAFQQLALSDCFRSGTWAARVTMCRAETRELDRCYAMQSRFLKALGYLGVQGQGAEAEEAVQMHADRLYRRMVERERVVEEARARGEEVGPAEELGSVLSGGSVGAALRGDLGVAAARVEGKQGGLDEAKMKEVEEKELARKLDEMRGLSPKTRKEFEDRLKDLHGVERELELAAIRGEFAESKLIAKQVEQLFEEERVKRLDRQSQGKETIGDTIKRWWGW